MEVGFENNQNRCKGLAKVEEDFGGGCSC